jgi:hypothetical protein
VHFEAFDKNLDFLDVKENEKISHPNRATVCLVLASRPPAMLEGALRSLSLLHLAVVVAPVTSDRNLLQDYQGLCLQYRARFFPNGSRSRKNAFQTALRLVLEDRAFDWIATMNDSATVRPDFLLIMEKWRNAETRPVLGGYWAESDGVSREFYHDGFHCVIPRRPNKEFLYAHRAYWKNHLEGSFRHSWFPARQRTAWNPQVPEPLVFPGLMITRESP